MSKLNIALVSGLLVLAAVLGAVALTRTTSFGSANRQSVDAAVRARTKQLDRFQASLARALAAKPKQPPAPRIVYHRPPPIVTVRHVHHGDAGESEGGGGDD